MRRHSQSGLAMAVLAVICGSCADPAVEEPAGLGVEALADAYFGQQPPGLTPQVFAPDLLSRTKPQWAFCAELYWVDARILESREPAP